MHYIRMLVLTLADEADVNLLTGSSSREPWSVVWVLQCSQGPYERPKRNGLITHFSIPIRAAASFFPL